ncbi:hypothetical protein [Polaromonas sp.]|uniref:hypothetical protein n=1 Tax=Polaromonas sp. TaxID=1869339 RepID=UPI003C96E670
MSKSPPRIAYKKAQDCLQEMRDSAQLDDLAHAWELFLIFHQRTWNKCEAHYKGSAFWGRLLAKYSAIRKRDPLLVYVHQARHVDEHGIQMISRQQAGTTTIGSGVLTGGTQITGGGVAIIGSGSTAPVTINPITVIAIPVVNRGQTYPPPVMNGRTPSVLQLADASMLIYDNLFAEIDAANGD